MSDFEIGDRLQLTIESLSQPHGEGVARFKGAVIFVPFTAPGDLISARIVARKKRLFRAETVEIIEPSQHRTKPPCPVFTQCGGCVWQHVQYSEQLVQKELNFKRHLLRRVDKNVIQPILGSPHPWHYRNRIQVHKSNSRVGYHRRQSHELVTVDHCPIAELSVSDGISALAQDERYPNGRYQIARQQSGEVKIFSKKTVDSSQFSQVNDSVNQLIQVKIQQYLQALEPQALLDLYGGDGNFSRFLQPFLANCQFSVVELDSQSIDRGRRLASEQNLSRIQFTTDSALSYLSALKAAQDVILVDPPREGLGPGVCGELERLKPKALLYVSCDTATLARDLDSLLGSFHVVETQPIDMFPQTGHLESLTFLRSDS